MDRLKLLVLEFCERPLMSLTIPKKEYSGEEEDIQESEYENSGHWPRTIIEAYSHWRGPYTLYNAEMLLQEEPLELYNGWLVWDKLTDFEERSFAANFEQILAMAAKLARYGQAYPDQVECQLKKGDIIKPDVCLISTTRATTKIARRGRRRRRLLQGGPELAVELRSPSNTRAEEELKRQKYFANDTLIVWDVLPEEHKILVWRPEDPTVSQEFGEGDIIDCEPLLPGWRRAVADFFNKELTAEEVIGHTVQEWREASRTEGLVEGRSEGRKQALQEMILLQANSKFGQELPADIAVRVGQLSIEQLTGLAVTLATSPGLTEWLDTLPI